MIISHISSFLKCPLHLKIILLVFRIPPVLFNHLLFGCFDEFNQCQYFLFWLLIETAFQIIRCQLFPEIGFHRKVRMPTFNSSRARNITAFPQTVGKSNLIPKFWASDFQLLKHIKFPFVLKFIMFSTSTGNCMFALRFWKPGYTLQSFFKFFFRQFIFC